MEPKVICNSWKEMTCLTTIIVGKRLAFPSWRYRKEGSSNKNLQTNVYQTKIVKHKPKAEKGTSVTIHSIIERANPTKARQKVN